MKHDTSKYRLYTPVGCVAHLCALCREAISLDPGVYTAAQIDQRIADHHMVCPKRPIEVGDYVRLDVLGVQFVGAWQEGTVEEFDPLGYAAIRLQKAGPDMVSEIGNVRRLWVKSLRRIPRPAEPQTNVLIDGLTREQCLASYEVRQKTDGRRVMTTAQLEVAREMWKERLAAKVAAGVEAERNRVRVDLDED